MYSENIDEGPITYDLIVARRRLPDKAFQYYCKPLNHKFRDSTWLTADEFEALPNASDLLNKGYLEISNRRASELYDPRYDEIDRVLLQDGQKYFILWQGLDILHATWESDIDPASLELFKTRASLRQPNSRDTDRWVALSYGPVHYDDFFSVSLNYLITCYNTRTQAQLMNDICLELEPFFLTFFDTLYNKGQYGPFLIVADSLDRWEYHLRKFRLMSLAYTGSDQARKILREKFLSKCHIILTTPNFEHELPDTYHVVMYHSNFTQPMMTGHGRFEMGLNAFSNSGRSEFINRISQTIHNYKNKLPREILDRFAHVKCKSSRSATHIYVNCPANDFQRQLFIRLCLTAAPNMTQRLLLQLLSHPMLIDPSFDEITSKVRALFDILKTERGSICILTQYQNLVELLYDLIEELDVVAKRIDVLNTFEGAKGEYDSAIIFDGSIEGLFISTRIYELVAEDCCEIELKKCAEKSWELPAMAVCTFIVNSQPQEYEGLSKKVVTNSMYEVFSDINPTPADFWPLFDVPPLPKSPHPENEGCWTRHELRQVFRGLYSFGYGNWDKMRTVCGINHSVQELSHVSQAILRFFCHTTKDYSFTQCLTDDPIPDFPDPHLLQSYKNEAGSFLSVMNKLYTLKTTAALGVSTANDLPSFSLDEEGPADWWTANTDRDLLMGVLKYGYHRFDEFSTDKDLRHIYDNVKFQLLRDRQTFLVKLLQSSYSLTNVRRIAILMTKKCEKTLEQVTNLVEGTGELDEDWISLILNDNVATDFDEFTTKFIDRDVLGLVNIRKLIQNHSEDLGLLIKAFPWDLATKRLQTAAEVNYYYQIQEEGFERVAEQLRPFMDGTRKTQYRNSDFLYNRVKKLASIPAGYDLSKITLPPDDERPKPKLVIHRQPPRKNLQDDGRDHEFTLAKTTKPKSKPKIDSDADADVPNPVPVSRTKPKFNYDDYMDSDDLADFTKATAPKKRWKKKHSSPDDEEDFHQSTAAPVDQKQTESGDDIKVVDQFKRIKSTTADTPDFSVSPSIAAALDSEEEEDGFMDEPVKKKSSKPKIPKPLEDEFRPNKKSADTTDKTEPKLKKPSRPPSRSKEVIRRVKPDSPSYDDVMSGNFTYPVQVSPTGYLISVGRIEFENAAFHTSRYVYPVGYKTKKFYTSCVNPEEKVFYVSEIVVGDNGNPFFQVYFEDDESVRFTGETPSSPWTQILKTISARCNEQRANTVSGPEAFLLSNNIVLAILQKMPDIEKCEHYTKKDIKPWK